MSDLLSGVSGSLGSFVRSWLLPSAVVVGLWAFFIYPLLDDSDPLHFAERLTSGERLGVIALAALCLAYIAAAVSFPVYQVLEGHRGWPNRLKNARILRHAEKLEALQQRVDDPSVSRADKQRALQQIDQYPRVAASVMPSRLGNILRAAETYSNDQYGMDSIVLWRPLVAATDETTRSALSETRGVMDVFVGVIILAPVFAAASVLPAIALGEPAAVSGAWSLVAVYPAYLGAVNAALPYGRAVRSVVHTARFGVADRLHLKVPIDADDEREFWKAVKNYLAWGPDRANSPAWAATIAESRVAYEDEHRPNNR